MGAVQGQRSGQEPSDGGSMYPSVWGWKEPAYTDMCSEAAGNFSDTSGAMLGTYGGYFEAGSAHPLKHRLHVFAFLASSNNRQTR